MYVGAIRIASLLNPKARSWVRGRKNQFKRLSASASAASLDYAAERVWIHCASLGEFEQGRPLIERIRKELPGAKIILTFYSPSGYEIRKDYPVADIVAYMPADLPRQVDRFLDIIRPTKAIFVKYEFWFNFLHALNRRNVPHYLISGIFRPQQIFFKWYGGWFRKFLSHYTFLFVQDTDSAELLKSKGINHCEVAGDTRYDRVHQLAGENKTIDAALSFSSSGTILVAGSTWEKDEDILGDWLRTKNAGAREFKLILAPHEITEERLYAIEQKFSFMNPCRYSAYSNDPSCKLLLIDHVGSLSTLYKYGSYAFIGGGYSKGIHNILEAAVYGKPIFFGPNFYKFKEAIDLVKAGGAFSIDAASELDARIDFFQKDPVLLQMASMLSKEFVLRRTGATTAIFNKIFGS